MSPEQTIASEADKTCCVQSVEAAAVVAQFAY